MHKLAEPTGLVDRYLRNELMAEEEAAFEEALLESPELQLKLETAMAIRQAVRLAEEDVKAEGAPTPPSPEPHHGWQPYALAASVVLAVFSTTMYWKVSNEAGVLRSEISDLNQPRTSILNVPIDIMRSADQQTPDRVIQKPGGNALLILDIEISPRVIALGHVHMTLRDMQATELISWDSGAFEAGRLAAAFDAGSLPDGKVWLEMSDDQGKVLDRRLLAFLPPAETQER